MELDGVIMPGAEIQPEIVKPTASLHDRISKAGFPVTNFVFDDAIPFDAANGMFNANPERGNPLVDIFLQLRKVIASGFLFWLEDGNASKGKSFKARILGELAVCGQRIVRLIGQFFVMLFAFDGLG